MTHHEILSEEFFGEFYADTFSDCPSDIYTSVSEDDSSSEYSFDSDDVNIRSKKRQKTLVTDWYGKWKWNSWYGECSFDSTEEWIEDNISRKLDFTGVSDVTIECNNLQSISEIRELIFGNNFFELVTSQTKLNHQQNKKSYKKYKTLK